MYVLPRPAGHWLWIVACHACLVVGTVRSDEPEPADPQKPAPGVPFELVYQRGHVVFLADVLKEKYGIKSVPESQQRVLALQSKDGSLVPLVEDLRGRSFRRDKRLREMEVVLMARKYQGLPMLQVIRIYRVDRKKVFELDYWCEICAIAMYELKACDCCQGDIELRQRPARLPVPLPR
mgnify:FL=1|tara:strand:- start:1460 stop:1996 length:537 start_codon:yes stop_codon:yes gene_type:complete